MRLNHHTRFQVPFSMVAYRELGLSYEQMRMRTFSICLYFLLLCEILAAREEREEEPRAPVAKKPKRSNPHETFLTWDEIIEHDKRSD